jgi:hypothetical protein
LPLWLRRISTVNESSITAASTVVYSMPVSKQRIVQEKSNGCEDNISESEVHKKQRLGLLYMFYFDWYNMGICQLLVCLSAQIEDDSIDKDGIESKNMAGIGEER